MVCVEHWRGLHVDLQPTGPTHKAFAGGPRGHSPFATHATPLWLRRTARLSGKAGRQGGEAGRVSPGGEVLKILSVGHRLNLISRIQEKTVAREVLQF